MCSEHITEVFVDVMDDMMCASNHLECASAIMRYMWPMYGPA